MSRSHEAFAEGTRMKPIGDGQSLPSVFILPRCHGLAFQKQIVQPADTGKPGFKRRIQETFRFGQSRFGVIERQELKKPFWADSCPPAKKSLKMELTELQAGSEFFLNQVVE